MARSRFFGLIVVCALVAAFAPTSDVRAQAADDGPPAAEPDAQPAHQPDYARNGIYLGARVGFSVPTQLEEPFNDLVQTLPPDDRPAVRNDARVGVDGTVGYRFHPHIAAEAQLQWINGMSVKVSGDESWYRGYTLATNANLRGYILTERFQPYVLLGAGFIQTSVTKDIRRADPDATVTSQGGLMKFGVGFDAYITEHIAFNLGADYLLAIGDQDIEEVRNITVAVGAMYRF